MRNLILLLITGLICILSCNNMSDNNNRNIKLHNTEETGINTIFIGCYDIHGSFREIKLPETLGGNDYSGMVEYALVIKGKTSTFEIKMLALYLESKSDIKKYFSATDSIKGYIEEFNNHFKTYKDSFTITKYSIKDTCEYEYLQSSFYINSPSDTILDNVVKYIISKSEESETISSQNQEQKGPQLPHRN